MVPGLTPTDEPMQNCHNGEYMKIRHHPAAYVNETLLVKLHNCGKARLLLQLYQRVLTQGGTQVQSTLSHTHSDTHTNISLHYREMCETNGSA